MANTNQTNNPKQISYELEKKLGEGGFGKVYKGSFVDVEGRKKEVAVKRIPVEFIDRREAEFLRNNDHPNILKLFHAERDDTFWNYAFELCAADLQDWADSKYTGVVPSEFVAINQMACGLAFVHKKIMFTVTYAQPTF